MDIQSPPSSRRLSPNGTNIHITALDGITNVNSIFTFAVFLGLSYDPSDPSYTLVTNPSCVAGKSIAESLITFHVYSFSSFLASSLIALTLKQAIRHPTSSVLNRVEIPVRVNKTALRVGMLVSGLGSVCGCGCLMMALVNVVQIKLGVLGCGASSYSYAAILPLITFVPLALLSYVCIVLYAFTR